MNRFVLDTSALLALLHGEPGVENLPEESELLARAAMSTVNLSEAQGKLVGNGSDPEEAWDAVTAPIREIFPLDEELAKAAGSLVPLTRAFGLSLGDRACLSLGMSLKTTVYTADRLWAKLDVGIPIKVIR